MKHPIKRNRRKLKLRAQRWAALKGAIGQELHGRTYRDRRLRMESW